MSKSLEDIDSRFRPFCVELVRRANVIEPCVVIDTLRTEAEHAVNIRNGTSKANRSKHCAQPPEGKSLAIDIAPKRVMKLKGWAPGDPVWKELGMMGKALAAEMGIQIRWGGDWKSPVDPGHFEMVVTL